MQFPSDGLLKFKYPQSFPYLSMPTPEEQVNGASHFEGSRHRLDAEDERSWLYYLAEISLRGVMNRILDVFYGHGEEKWTHSILSLLNKHASSSETLALW